MAHTPAPQRRAQLIAAAWRVMTRDGLAAATTRAICREAAVSQGVFHYCFQSRDAMLRELALDLLPDQLASADAALDGASDLKTAINRALKAYWDLVEADIAVHQALYEITVTAMRTPTMRDIARGQYKRYLTGARAVLDRLTEQYAVSWQRSLDVIAWQVVTIVDGLTLHYAVDQDSAAVRAALAAFAADLARLGRPDPTTSPAQAMATRKDIS